jgi:hypothetical protein
MLSSLRTALQQPSYTLIRSPALLRPLSSLHRFISSPSLSSISSGDLESYVSAAHFRLSRPFAIKNVARFRSSDYTWKRLPSTATLVRWVRDSHRKGPHKAEVFAATQSVRNGVWIAEVYVHDDGSEVRLQEERVVVVGKGRRRGLNAAIEERVAFSSSLLIVLTLPSRAEPRRTP